MAYLKLNGSQLSITLDSPIQLCKNTLDFTKFNHAGFNFRLKMTANSTPLYSPLAALDEMMASTCFCKLREKCEDKSSAECLKHRNLYAEAMLGRNAKH